jgi:predicted DNA binding protein
VNYSASRCAVSVRDREDAVVGRDLARLARQFEVELVAVGDHNRRVTNDVDGEIVVSAAEIDGNQALTLVFVLGSHGILTVIGAQFLRRSHREILVLAACKHSARRCWGGCVCRVVGAAAGGTIASRRVRGYQHPFICKCDSVCMPTIAEFAIPTEQFVLRETLDRRPDLRFEVDRVVAHATARVMPFVWVSGADDELEGLTAILDDDPSVETVDLLTEDESGRFYRLEWADEARLIGYMVIEHDATVRRAIAANGRWNLRVLFPDRSDVSATNDFAREHGLSLTLERLHGVDEYHRVQFGLTDRQHTTLVESYEQGYYEVPRESDMNALADILDVSHQALSERLRRATGSLIENALVVDEDEPE